MAANEITVTVNVEKILSFDDWYQIYRSLESDLNDYESSNGWFTEEYRIDRVQFINELLLKVAVLKKEAKRQVTS